MADANGPRQARGILLLLAVAFMGAVYGLAYLLSGRFLDRTGVGYALGVGIAAGLASLLLCGALARSPALRRAGPVLLLLAAAAIFWLLALPVLRRPDAFYGYQGTYQVSYSDGRSETVDGSVLNQQEWSKHTGGWLALALAPACVALGFLAGALRKKPAV